jgi:hypothetical protein
LVKLQQGIEQRHETTESSKKIMALSTDNVISSL